MSAPRLAPARVFFGAIWADTTVASIRPGTIYHGHVIAAAFGARWERPWAWGCLAAGGRAVLAPSGARTHAAAPAAALVLLGMAVPRKRGARPAAVDIPLEDTRYHALFDGTPVQILEEDFTAVEAAFARLRAQGITNLVAHLAEHPGLPRELLGLLRLRDANRPAIAAAGVPSRKEMVASFPALVTAPYLEVFDHQLESLWARRRQFEEEFRYLDAKGQERACLMLCRVHRPRRGAGSGPRRAGPARHHRGAGDGGGADGESGGDAPDPRPRQHPAVVGPGAPGRRPFPLDINVPRSPSTARCIKLATAMDRGGLWDIEHAPDLAETSRRSEQALLSGSPGYQQQFRVFSPEGTHWLSEDVAIRRLEEDEWSLFGVVTDVTAQHDAEEARKKSQAQLEQILARTDCMLWQAHVTETAGRLHWRIEAPVSGLQKRIFGSDGGVVYEGLTGDEQPLSRGFTTPEQAEMDARSWAALHSSAPGYEQEYRLIKGDQVLWLHERVSIAPTGPGQWDLTGISIDVTAQHTAEEARRASETQLRQLLERADCLVWQSRVRRVGDELQWGRVRVPDSPLYSLIFGADHDSTEKLLWTLVDVPEMPEMNRRSRAAILSGAPGYEQEFRIVQAGTHPVDARTHVDHPGGSGRVGDCRDGDQDVTARHEAEEARRATEAQLQQLLTRADCLSGSANVMREGAGCGGAISRCPPPCSANACSAPIRPPRGPAFGSPRIPRSCRR